MILVEFAEKGSLLKYLRDHRQQNYDDMNQYSLDISSSQRLRIACDVANGMSHLAAIKVTYYKRIMIRIFLDIKTDYRAFSHDFKAAKLVSQTNPVGVELFSFVNAFFFPIYLHIYWPRERKRSIRVR